MYSACPDCGHAASLVTTFDDKQLRDKGAFTVTCSVCPFEAYVPAEATARTRIGKLREINTTRMCARIDGYLVDITTAHLLVQVYDALSVKNRELFGKPSMPRLVELAWKVATAL